MGMGIMLASCPKHGEYAVSPAANRGMGCPLCNQVIERAEHRMTIDPEAVTLLRSMRGAVQTAEMWISVWSDMLDRLLLRKAMRRDQFDSLMLTVELFSEYIDDVDSAAVDIGKELGMDWPDDETPEDVAHGEEVDLDVLVGHDGNPWGIPEVTA